MYGSVVSGLLLMDPLPSLITIFSKFVTEERHQSLVPSQETRGEVEGFAAQGAVRGRGR